MGMERVIDDARDLNLRGVVLGGDRPAVGRTEPEVAAPPKRRPGRPTNAEIAARSPQQYPMTKVEGVVGVGEVYSQQGVVTKVNGVTLKSAAHPAPPPLPEDISEDAVETVEIELPDDAMFVFSDDAPELPPRPSGQGPSPYPKQLAKLSKKNPFLLIAATKEKPQRPSFGSYIKTMARDAGINVTVRRNFEYFGRTGLGVWYVGVLPKKE